MNRPLKMIKKMGIKYIIFFFVVQKLVYTTNIYCANLHTYTHKYYTYTCIFFNSLNNKLFLPRPLYYALGKHKNTPICKRKKSKSQLLEMPVF